MLLLTIELLLVVMTYIVSSSWLTAGIALIITLLGHVGFNDQNPFSKALNTFYVACTASLIYLFGIYANILAKTIPDGHFAGMKDSLLEIGLIFTAGATPPFSITGDGSNDLAIFIFGFAIIETLLQLINLYLKHRHH
ncbi:hypothetical protein [Pseudoalteromonas sp. MB47]|uniref:hypothetical protein n=1 Tax=Pseudoalteromonas sp. MB47 TaxID=2588452 RepID=UPI00140E8F28|nr:hypothetical protein [Pseudoalteromonas sp. MB47]NHH90509.1 hypothetical protein [Pseudoalteromonas sp. MB47]